MLVITYQPFYYVQIFTSTRNSQPENILKRKYPLIKIFNIRSVFSWGWSSIPLKIRLHFLLRAGNWRKFSFSFSFSLIMESLSSSVDCFHLSMFWRSSNIACWFTLVNYLLKYLANQLFYSTPWSISSFLNVCVISHSKLSNKIEKSMYVIKYHIKRRFQCMNGSQFHITSQCATCSGWQH